MLRPYFCAYHSYLENMELLNSEERGRLFTALLEYSKDGTLIPLTGNERFVFPGIRSQIDRDKAQWEQIDNVKTANGRKGGRPKKAETEKANGLDENLKNQQVISVSKKSLYDVPALLDGKGFIAVNDPACGAGALLLSFANICKRKGINYQEKVLFVAQDIDYTVGLMCYIQLSLMGCAGYVVIGDTLINPCTAYDKKGLLPAGDPERIWFTPLFSDGIWYGRRLAAQMDLLISGSSRKSPENVNSFTEKPEKVADSPAKDTKKPCSFTKPAKAAAQVSTPVSTKKVETWKPAELNETKNGQLTFF